MRKSWKKGFFYFAQTERHFTYNCIKYAISQQRESGCGTFTLFWISRQYFPRAFSFVKKVNKPSKILLDFYFLNYMVPIRKLWGQSLFAKCSWTHKEEPQKKRLAFVREYERALTCKMTPMVFSSLGATNRDSHAPVKYRIPKMEASLDNFCLLHFSANGRRCSRTSSWKNIFRFSGKFSLMNLVLVSSPGTWQLDIGKGTLKRKICVNLKSSFSKYV